MKVIHLNLVRALGEGRTPRGKELQDSKRLAAVMWCNFKAKNARDWWIMLATRKGRILRARVLVFLVLLLASKRGLPVRKACLLQGAQSRLHRQATPNERRNRVIEE